jgi:hypothetical protein
MTRILTIAFRLIITSVLFCSCFAAGTQAQTPSADSKQTPENQIDPSGRTESICS